jgi:hypothetical protein
MTMGHSTNKIKRELPRISIKVELAFLLVYWKLPHSSISFKQVKEAGLKLTSRQRFVQRKCYSIQQPEATDTIQ